MKLIIQNDNGENIYERDAGLYEFNDILKCKDCKHYIQHYVKSSIPTTNGYICCNSIERVCMSPTSVGHCVGGRSPKEVKRDGRVCNNFVLNL